MIFLKELLATKENLKAGPLSWAKPLSGRIWTVSSSFFRWFKILTGGRMKKWTI